jgi:NADPH-dependent F420 reductase
LAKEPLKVMTLAVLGGTGKEGQGLVLRWADSGYRVLIGSRDAAKAEAKAQELNDVLGEDVIHGLGNVEAAAAADVVVLTVPYAGHAAILEAIRDVVQGKIVVDVTVPVLPPHIRTVYIPEGLAASLEAQEILGDGVQVVAALQNVGAGHLKDLKHPINCDVLVCGDNEEAKADVQQLIEAIDGLRGIDAGPLANAVAVEALTRVLMYVSKRYKISGAGIRITGLE